MRRMRFSVGAVVHKVNGGGHLTIEDGYLVLEPGAVTRRLTGVNRVIHQNATVQVVRSRLLPPWMSTHLLISDGQEAVLAGVPAWMRSKVLDALQSHGFVVKQSRSLFSRWPDRTALA